VEESLGASPLQDKGDSQLKCVCISALMLGLALAGPAVAQAQTATGCPTPLIDIGALTIDSDFTIFMRKEVPENVRRAALRRLWVLMQLPASCQALCSEVESSASGPTRLSSEKLDVDTLTLMLLAWIAAKTGLAAPQPPRIAFVREDQMRHIFDVGADPDQQPQADVPADQGARDAHQTSGVLAFYLRATATVYLPETWRRGALRHQSILLHELVHHGQRFNKVVTACPGALERQAYELQAAWLREQGIAEPYKLIGTDEFTVLVLSACMPPDW
jgi:hypothetical protein